MTDQIAQPKGRLKPSISQRSLIRIDTLIRLRWYAIIGQAGSVVVIAMGFGYAIPWSICLLLIAASAGLNILLTWRFKTSHRLEPNDAFTLLAFDVAQLGVLLWLTGGLRNPFAVLLLAPVIVSATSLYKRHTVGLGLLAIVVISLLAFFHLPLPWDPSNPLILPDLYVGGVWGALVCTLLFTGIYVFRVAEEARKLGNALTATELVLQREQHLSALDGLAAAAAHELGTPLATIAVVSKEMLHALPEDDPMREDAALLRSQAERCREILGKLTSLSSEGETIIEEQSLSALVEEEVQPLRSYEKSISIHHHGDAASEPYVTRAPGVHYGLGNLLDNAVDFATSEVLISVLWDDTVAQVTISDDGKGYPPALLSQLGEPFVSGRKKKRNATQRGMGLGLFISKTLLERSGAKVTFSNGSTSGDSNLRGAVVMVQWPRIPQASADQNDGTQSGQTFIRQPLAALA